MLDFQGFSDFPIFRLFAGRNAYTYIAASYGQIRLTYLGIANQLLLAIITAAKLILVLWLRRYSESCRVPLKLILCTVSLGAS